MHFLEPKHGLGREQWGIPETRWQRVLSWRGMIQFVHPLLAWAGAAGIALAWGAAETRTGVLASLAVVFLALACALSCRAVYLACRPDILLCEAGLLWGRTAKCRRELRWDEPFTCGWDPRRPRLLGVKRPQEILQLRIPACSCERLVAELRRQGKWADATG